jgi:hypothetical protein
MEYNPGMRRGPGAAVVPPAYVRFARYCHAAPAPAFLACVVMRAFSAGLGVVDAKRGDRSRGEVGVLGARGAEDLRLAAVGGLEDRGLILLAIERETQGI